MIESSGDGLVIFALVVLLLVSALVIGLGISDAEKTSAREDLCKKYGYEIVAYANSEYYCIGDGTSALIIRQNNQYELR